MEDIAQKLKDSRKKMNLTIEQISDKTKIRPYILQSLESNNFTVMPTVYINSFLKTLCEFYKIDLLTLSSDPKHKDKSKQKDKVADGESVSKQKIVFNDNFDKSSIKSEKIQTDNKSERVVLINKGDSPINEFKDLFRKKNIKKAPKTSYFNYLVFGGLLIALLFAIYFSFFYTSSNSSQKSNTDKNNSDTAVINSNEKSLLSIFTKSDSLKLTVKAIDTAWVRIQIDGNLMQEKLFKPNMEDIFSAKEFFLIDQGNIGALKFYRNGQELPLFGTRGSIIKNVRVTANEVLSPNPFRVDTSVKKIKPRVRVKEEIKPGYKMIEPTKILEKPNPFKKN